MKRLLKILLVVIGVIVVLIVAAIIALPLFFDPNDYKTQINAAIEREIGREVTVSGDIELSVFPWLGLELGRVDVANAPGFDKAPMAEMQSAGISVRLLPLLTREIEIGTVSLNGLNLRLARNANGRSNWDDIVERLAAEQGSEEETSDTPEAETDSGFKLSSLQIGAIDIRDAAVSWRDATTGADYRASAVKLVTGRLSDREPVRLELSGDFAAPQEKVAGEVNLVTRVEPDIAESFYRFTNLSINVIASGDAVPAGRQQATLGGSGELDMAEGRFKISDLKLQAVGLIVTGNVDASDINSKPSYAGRITFKNFDPKAVMRELAIPALATQNGSALSSAGFDAQFDATGDRVQFKQILATLDDSSLKGSGRVTNFAKPEIGFDLNLDEINIDHYLPPGSAEQAQTNKPAETGGGKEQEDAEIDLSVLDDLRLDGKLAVGSLTAANLHVTNAKLAIKARDGVLTIEPLTADLYDGNLRVTARVDASKDTPRYALKGNLNGLQFAPLLEDMAGTDKVSALANMNIDVSTAGKQVASMKRALNGNVGFDLRDGAFSDFNLAKIIAGARSALSGGESSATTSTNGIAEGDSTPFNRFAAAFKVDDGVMAGKDLKLDSRLINAQGSGSYDIAANALDYTLQAQIPEDASGTLKKLAGVTVPIKLSGNLLSPNYKLDMAAALRGLADQRLQEQKTKLQSKVREKLDERSKKVDGELRNKIQQGLSGFLGGGDKDDGKSGNDQAE